MNVLINNRNSYVGLRFQAFAYTLHILYVSVKKETKTYVERIIIYLWSDIREANIMQMYWIPCACVLMHAQRQTSIATYNDEMPSRKELWSVCCWACLVMLKTLARFELICSETTSKHARQHHSPLKSHCERYVICTFPLRAMKVWVCWRWCDIYILPSTKHKWMSRVSIENSKRMYFKFERNKKSALPDYAQLQLALNKRRRKRA